MKFERLTLTDFQSYNDLDTAFGDGLTLIHGANGSGKSTIARALYTTLYPRHGRSHIGPHGLVDLIQDGKDSATTELVFSIGDDRYRITVDIRRKSDGGAAAAAEMTILETGETYSTSSTEIEEKVTQLLGMDAEAYAHSTYAQQTELKRLIEAPPSEREAMLDNLLGLTAPDECEEDVREVTRTIEKWQEGRRERLHTVREDIDELEASDPKATLQAKTEEVDRLEERIEELDAGVDDARERLRDTQGEIDDHHERQSNLKEREDDRDATKRDIAELREHIEELEADIEKCGKDIDDQQERIAALDDQVDDYDLTDAEGADAAVEHYEERYDDVSATTEQKREAVNTAEATVERLEGELDNLQEELEDAEARRDAREDAVDEAEEVLADADSKLERRREERDDVLREYLNGSLDDFDDHEAAVRDRMDTLREEKGNLETERDTKRDRRSRLKEEISEAEDELDEARERHADIRQSLEADVDDPEAAFEAAVERADEAASTLGFSVSAGDIETVFTGNLPQELEDAFDAHRDAAEELAGARETTGRTSAHIDDLRSLTDGEWPLDGGAIGASHNYDDHLERLKAEHSSAEASADEARVDINAAETQLDSVQRVAEALFEAASFRALADVAAEIDDLWTTIETGLATCEELEDDVESLQEEIEGLESTLDDGEAALAAVEDAEEAADAVEAAEREVDDARDELEAVEGELADLADDVAAKEDALEDAREAVGEAESNLETAEATLSTVEAARKAARNAREAHSEIERLEDNRDGHRSRCDDRDELLEEKHEELQEIEADIEDLEAALGDTKLDELEKRRDETEEFLGEVETKLEETREERDDALDARSRAEERLERLRDQRERKGELQEKIEWAQGLLNDFEAITETYAQVQTKMREKVLGRLRLRTNEVFQDLYLNSTYEAVDIDEDYNLRLVTSNETTRDPHKASGGEGVLVTIALRAGVYRVLADQAEGRDERLPPFILDEPTNHLDPMHIDQLDEAVESIRDWDVPQVFVIDRYESLIEGADHRIHVKMDDGEGASTIDTEPPGGDEPGVAEAGGD